MAWTQLSLHAELETRKSDLAALDAELKEAQANLDSAKKARDELKAARAL